MNKTNLKKAKKIYASEEHPVIVCRTCGLATDKIIRKVSDTLRGRKKRKYNGKSSTEKPQKRWQRTIKPSNQHKTTCRGKECRAKEIFFSYVMLECISRKHKLSIRRKPFSK